MQPFDKNKIITGILKACEKRPVTLVQIENIASNIEQEVKNSVNQEIESVKIGEMVLEMLKPLDQISYVRFASVYKQFADAQSFVNFLKEN